MKRNFLFVVMMAVMMAASVNLTSCGGDDDASEKPAQPAQTSLNGTWVNTTESNELAVALTFDSGNNVVAFIEGDIEGHPDQDGELQRLRVVHCARPECEGDYRHGLRTE